MEYLASITVRTLLLASLAGLALWVCRVKSPSARHAVWTLVTGGMLLQAVLIPWLPAVRIPVLKPVIAARPLMINGASPAVTIADSEFAATAPKPRLTVNQAISYVYGMGVVWCMAQLVYAAWFTRRLVRESLALNGHRYESRRISVPVTVGRRILLPQGWREWDAAKLAAVLAHEEAHVARRDWAVAAMVRVNRCVFWFHPLAWWLERELARLAEQVCDDAALAVAPDRHTYASVLMDMARAAGARRVFGTVAMAKESKMERRINRILDASRRINRGLSRAAWLTLSVCGALLVYLAAVVQLAPAQSPDQGHAAVQTAPSTPAPAPAPRLVAQERPQRPPAPARQAVPADTAVGSLSGTVVDPWGARVPGVIVRASGPQGDSFTSTNAIGEWTLPSLLPGSYSLVISVPGFVENRRAGIDVAAGTANHVETSLIMGSTQETVTIKAAGNPRPALGRTGGPVRVGGNVQPARRTKNVDPVYPQSARDQGLRGPVIIQALIGKSGLLMQARVVNNAPAELSDAALAAVQNWEYVPALLDGEPVDTLTTITINFQLDQQ